MARMYTAPINITTGVPTPAQIDVFEILAGTAKPCRLIGFEISQTSEVGDAQEEMLTLELFRNTGGTSGSGGGTSTFQIVETTSTATAAAATVETGNTTKLTAGTNQPLRRYAWNVRSSYLWLPPPRMQDEWAAGDRLVLELETTPADAITSLMGWVQIEELV